MLLRFASVRRNQSRLVQLLKTILETADANVVAPVQWIEPIIAVHAWCTRAIFVVFSGPGPADSGTNMAMTEKTPANLGRDQPHFDLLGLQLQLQLQSDDDREPGTLIRPNALHVELSAVRNGKSRCGDDRRCHQWYAS